MDAVEQEWQWLQCLIRRAGLGRVVLESKCQLDAARDADMPALKLEPVKQLSQGDDPTEAALTV